MKTNKVLTLAMVAAFAGFTMTSCSDDEKTPEIVEDPIKDIVEYYISGKVVDESGNPLGNVNITAEGAEAAKTNDKGQFTLTVAEKSSYTVVAELENYISSNGTEVRIPETATNRSSMNLNITLSKTAANVGITDDDVKNGVVIVEGDKKTSLGNVSSGSAAIEIPADKVSSGFNVSMTEYIPAPQSSENSNATGTASVTNVKITTDKGVNAGGITLAYKNPDNEPTFESMDVYRVITKSRAGKNEEKIGTATYDAATNSYKYPIEEGELGGEYSFKVDFSRSVSGVKYELAKEDKKDNSGNFTAVKDYTIKFTEKAGWEYTEELPENLKNILEGIVASQEGSNGVYSVDKEFKTNISGNHIMYYKVENGYTETIYTIKLHGGKNQHVKIKVYKGNKFTYSQEEANKHSGGTGGSSK